MAIRESVCAVEEPLREGRTGCATGTGVEVVEFNRRLMKPWSKEGWEVRPSRQRTFSLYVR